MEDLLLFISQHADYAPYIIFGSLLLAGFNIPVSEDLMLIASAMLAHKRPDLTYQLFIGVYLGAYLSDLICYGIGRKLGRHLWEVKFFAKMVSKDNVYKIMEFYHKYGVITLIFGRFIPFGIRNGLFLTAGIGKMKFLRFALADLLACTISTVTIFTLAYKLQDKVIDLVKRFNIAIFIIALLVVIAIVIIKKTNRNKTM